MQGKRYSKEEKQKILDFLKNHTYEETQNEFKVSQTTLARWSKESNTNIKSKLEEQLDPCLKMLKLIEGVKNICLISAEGLPIACDLEGGKDKMTFAAMTAAITSLSERVGLQYGHGYLESTIINSIKGKIIILVAGRNAFLTIEFDDSVDLKHIINTSFYYIDRIREIIGTYVH
jgi:predicted regulator of Ras-like GTPase activity (Roadblock/LC7/MglB family)